MGDGITSLGHAQRLRRVLNVVEISRSCGGH
jgi:hypothetical protein